MHDVVLHVIFVLFTPFLLSISLSLREENDCSSYRKNEVCFITRCRF